MVRVEKTYALGPRCHFLGSITMNNTYKTITKTLSRGCLASRLDMDAIRSFFTPRMGCRALNIIDEGKKVP
jgi:hypothetical protein